MMRFTALATALATTAVALAAVVTASPEDPYADDWVALAVSFSKDAGAYGTAGNADLASQIAMTECGKKASDCMVTAVLQYGCVFFAHNTKTGEVATGRGPDPETASNDATSKMQPFELGDVTGGPKCSTPMTAPN